MKSTPLQRLQEFDEITREELQAAIDKAQRRCDTIGLALHIEKADGQFRVTVSRPSREDTE
jgi:ribonuclease PH